MIRAMLVAVALASSPAGDAGDTARRAELLAPGRWKLRVPAADGGQLTLFRYVPAVPRSGPPVLLVPELGFTHASFDVNGFGLAPWLQRRGREVFVLERRAGVALPAVVLEELPAAIEAISALHAPNATRIDLIGHGYGGALAIAGAAGRGDVGRVVALAVPYAPTLPNATFREVLERGRAFGEDAASFEFLFARGTGIPARRLTAAREATLRPLSAETRSAWLQWAAEGDLRLDGEDSVRRRLARVERPVLVVMPLLDYVVHPEHSAPWREARPGGVKVLLLSKLYLLEEDYTHLSMLLADSAPEDVFEPLLRFLGEGAR